MKALLGALAIGIMVAAQPVAARPWSRGFAPILQAQDQRLSPRGQDRRGQRDMRRDQRMPPQRMAPERDMRQDQRMPPQRMAPERDERARGRLTDEERQDLRRDIDKASREIYRRRQQR
jgi:hypothetical protein